MMFSENVDAINRQIVSAEQVLPSCDFGRAYSFTSQDDFYASPIHFLNVAEQHYGRILSARKTTSLHGGVYVGAAGLVNLSYAGAFKASEAVFFDLNAYQKIFWDELFSMIAETPDVEDFKRKFPQIIKLVEFKIETLLATADVAPNNKYSHEISLFRDGIDAKTIKMWFDHAIKSGDLAWHDDYGHLHAMAKAGKLSALTMDVCDVESGQQLAGCLADSNLPKASYVYVSNIFNFLSGYTDWSKRVVPNGKTSPSNARESLSQFMDEDTLIISGKELHTNFWQTTVVDRAHMRLHGRSGMTEVPLIRPG